MLKEIGEALKRKYSVRMEWWERYTVIFHKLVKMLHQAEKPFIGPIIRKAAMIDNMEKRFTQGRVIPVNSELSEKAKQGSTVVPIHLMEKLIREAPNRYIVHRCICRDGGDCQDFPHDHACIFLGEGSHVTYERGISREVTVEEALEHLHKGTELGFVCQCLWIEAEQFFWGFPADKMQNFLEICFCCSCCCLALNSCRKVPSVFENRFQSLGFKAKANDLCDLCGECQSICPTHSITMGDKYAEISDRCLGCGLCVSRCPHEAIEVVQVEPLKGDIKDYFWGFRPEV